MHDANGYQGKTCGEGREVDVHIISCGFVVVELRFSIINKPMNKLTSTKKELRNKEQKILRVLGK